MVANAFHALIKLLHEMFYFTASKVSIQKKILSCPFLNFNPAFSLLINLSVAEFFLQMNSLKSHFIKEKIYLPNVVEFRIGAYSKSLRIGPHGIEFSMGMKFCTTNGLNILESSNWNKSRPTPIATSVTHVQIRSGLLRKIILR